MSLTDSFPERALASLVSQAAARLRGAAIEFPRMEARILLAHVCQSTVEDIVAERFAPSPENLERFEAALKRRIGHEPMAYITGAREFWSLLFHVDSNVLIPRPETELLIEEALRRFPDKETPLRVLDLGTGSGCLLLAFLSERPRAAGTGIDASKGAIGVAKANARALGLSARSRFLVSDWAELHGRYDLVFANPPYIRSAEIAALAPDVAAYEPLAALDGGRDGLDAYRSLAEVLPRVLNRGASAFIELGQGQAQSAAKIFRDRGLTVNGIVKDLADIPRCLCLAR